MVGKGSREHNEFSQWCGVRLEWHWTLKLKPEATANLRGMADGSLVFDIADETFHINSLDKDNYSRKILTLSSFPHPSITPAYITPRTHILPSRKQLHFMATALKDCSSSEGDYNNALQPELSVESRWMENANEVEKLQPSTFDCDVHYNVTDVYV